VIAVLDYGIGNLRSAEKALAYLGADVRLATTLEEAEGASAVVLPGVGAFGACAQALRASGLDVVARRAIDDGLPFLGICVGYQLLFEGSDESPDEPGLGIFSGRVERLGGDVKLPQIQWNQVRSDRHGDMFPAGDVDPWFYFVHSYAPVPTGSSVQAIAGTAEYGERFVAAVETGQLWGVQFHPEKSGTTGLALLGRFVELTERTASGVAGVSNQA
jgi:imidazole glycerol-phosphate synthase subunit HisH